MNAVEILAALIAWSGGTGTAGAGGADMFLQSLPEFGDILSGDSVEFRYRRAEFDSESPSAIPERVFEGVTRIEFRDTGIFTYDMFLEDRPESGGFGVAFRERTFHSFLTGEYVRTTRMPGAGSDRVIIERWKGFPHLTFLAIGLLGTSTLLSESQLRDVRRLEAGLVEEEYVLTNGKVVTMTFDPAPPGKLVRAESRSNDGAWTEVFYFSGHVDGFGGLPARPTSIVNAKVARDGGVQVVTVWQAVRLLDIEAARDDVVETNALVANLRTTEAERVDRATDRDVPLERLLTDPSALARPHELAPIELAAERFVPQPVEAGLEWADVGAVASLLLIGGAFLARKRSA